MFKLETNRLKRDFKITDSNFFASQIYNKYSDMSFVPDGNGSEFLIKFENGSEFSAKGLAVIDSKEENGKLSFVFEENMGVIVTLEYWAHSDSNSICKQITIDQSNEEKIDYVLLENMGIINSKTHFSVDVMEDAQINGVQAALGQPFYIDSLFFGSEFPATENRIVHGAGQIKYYAGKVLGTQFKCPVTITGAAKDNTIVEVKKAFFEYIDFISRKSELRFQYNSWYDEFRNITEESVIASFDAVAKGLAFHDAPKLAAFVIDDGWCDYKAKFWSENKNFPNKLHDAAKYCKSNGSSLGLWLGPRGGYNKQVQFAKKIQRGKNGYFNKDAKEICVASPKYVTKLEDYLINKVDELDLSYLKLDGFCTKACSDPSHGHNVGGPNDLYFVTDMWENWVKLFTNLRAARDEKNAPLWINMTCYVNVSPWWLQWVNSIWIQNSNDIGFAENVEDQQQVEAEMTYRDARYFDTLCRRANQIPLKNLYNHEPIYGKMAKVEYTDKEFEKYIMWNTVRGAALNEIHISVDMMNDYKWNALSKAMHFQKENFSILKNASFIGGDPEDNNIYGYISWTEDGNGIIALRNPTNEKTALTLNLNKLMGVPEDLENAKCTNIYNNSMPEFDKTFSYADKIDLALNPFEIMIFKFESKKED